MTDHDDEQPAPALKGARLSLYAALNPMPPLRQYATLEEMQEAVGQNAPAVGSALAVAAAQLPHEIRMGADAAEQFRSYARSLGRAPLGAPGDNLGGLPWALATPIHTVDAYPPNLWVMVDGDGRALSAGVLHHHPDDEASR